MEKLVRGESKRAAHARHGAAQVGARAEVRPLTQELGGVPLLLQRIVRRRRAEKL